MPLVSAMEAAYNNGYEGHADRGYLKRQSLRDCLFYFDGQ